MNAPHEFGPDGRMDRAVAAKTRHRRKRVCAYTHTEMRLTAVRRTGMTVMRGAFVNDFKELRIKAAL